MVEDRDVVMFLRKVSSRLYEIAKQIEELCNEIDEFTDKYEDSRVMEYEYCEYRYLCQNCGYEFETYGKCPKCGSNDVIQIAKD